ncbi:MAG TPA: S-layer homology domain-containing protein, partial [Kofleriaceae bacterium]|nr:S-layer homology domain-containing protein [Kofleriaceae bacterium]
HWGVFAGSGHDRGQKPGSCFTPGGCFATAVPEAIGSRFADLPDQADGQPAAAALVDRGDLATCGASGAREMFCPACPTTRRDAVRLVVRAGAVDGTAPASPSFSDVPLDDPAYAEIEVAAAAGLIAGCGDGAFCPDAPIARADLVALVGGAAPGCELLAGEGERVPRLEAAAMAAAAFDVDGDGSCAPDPDPDGDGGDGDDPSGDREGGGGCAIEPGGSAGGGALALLWLATALRRRKNTR